MASSDYKHNLSSTSMQTINDSILMPRVLTQCHELWKNYQNAIYPCKGMSPLNKEHITVQPVHSQTQRHGDTIP